jgi:hypothetical protein
MRRTLLIGCFWAFALTALAAEPEYPRNIARWQEVSVPPATNQGDRRVWFSAANWSNNEWDVYAEHGDICARRITGKTPKQGDRPKFIPKAGQFRGAVSSLGFPNYACALVDDGWLVGFNQGEFGAALYWFSPDGERNYKVSDHQVAGFFSLSNGLHAIEGLAHMGSSEDSVIRIARPRPDARWEAATAMKLPFAPFAISVRRDGTMLIMLSDSLVSIGPDRKIHTLLSEPPWGGFHSLLLSRDEKKLYIGMRQYVGEFDLLTKKLRLLIPSDEFLNKLPEEDKERNRNQ